MTGNKTYTEEQVAEMIEAKIAEMKAEAEATVVETEVIEEKKPRKRIEFFSKAGSVIDSGINKGREWWTDHWKTVVTVVGVGAGAALAKAAVDKVSEYDTTSAQLLPGTYEPEPWEDYDRIEAAGIAAMNEELERQRAEAEAPIEEAGAHEA